MLDFNELRKQYPEFVYHSYSIAFADGCMRVEYRFEITGLAVFTPRWTFPLQSADGLDTALIENMVFSLGMVELISYWKAACCPTVKIKPHGLTEKMIDWWKRLYFGGLGEFFYTNGIKTDLDTFMKIESSGEVLAPSSATAALSGNLVPIGGGKDSAVTLRILSSEKEQTLPYIINSRGATDLTCEVAGYKNPYRVSRTIDKNLIALNSQGFLNGHTPFSAIVAFSSLISAYLNRKRYIVLSNESSANESTVLGEDINHQFSKGEVFERAFREYEKEYINSGAEYFSLLRPLSEMQIAALFSRFSEYHGIFKSCNVGSKKDVWCCNCPKCLFVYIIMSPFLDTAQLVGIFGENLFEKESLLKTYKELLGVLPNKPFECVGSRDEVVSASRAVLLRLKELGERIPALLEYFENETKLSARPIEDYMSFYDANNHLPFHFNGLLQTALKEYIPNV